MTVSILLILAAIAFLGYTVQTVTGFGAMVVAVPLGAQLLPVPELLLLLLPLSVLQCTFVAVRYRAQIDWQLLCRWILPAMGAGTAVGAAIAGELSGTTLRRVLAVLILAIAVYELVRLSRDGRATRQPSTPVTLVGLFGAGLMHGIYATGGPLLVYTVGRKTEAKDAQRSTLIIVWLVLNSALISFFLIDGRYGSEHPGIIALLLIPVAIGIAVGERLVKLVEGKRFRQLTFSLVAVSALLLLIR